MWLYMSFNRKRSETQTVYDFAFSDFQGMSIMNVNLEIIINILHIQSSNSVKGVILYSVLFF